MLSLAVLLSIATLGFCVAMMQARGNLELMLITRHRDFMRSLKINFLGEPIEEHDFNRGFREREFSIELDDKLTRYSELLEDSGVLSRLGDAQVDDLCLRYIKLKNRAWTMAAVSLTAWFTALFFFLF